MQLIIGNHIIENDDYGYKVSNFKKDLREPDGYRRTKTVYPGRLGRALEVVLERRLSKKDQMTAQELLVELRVLQQVAGENG